MADAHQVADQEERDDFYRAFCQAASFQGRLAYCLMSFHAVNPYIIQTFTDYNPDSFLLWNMIYGVTVMIASRPCLSTIIPLQRFTFSLLGSLAFNYSSMLWFLWLRYSLENNPYVATFLGYLSGRIFMIHLVGFLYHIDTRCTEPDIRPRRDPTFEAMYL